MRVEIHSEEFYRRFLDFLADRFCDFFDEPLRDDDDPTATGVGAAASAVPVTGFFLGNSNRSAKPQRLEAMK